jgi:hypothetical protein
MRRLNFWVCALLAISLMTTLVLAEAEIGPIHPENLNETPAGRHTSSNTPTLNAYAGNVSALTIYTEAITQGWQGYFGNITGTITLDDSLNRTLYDWALTSPEGEVYATTTNIVSWYNVSCPTANNISYHENTTYKFNTYANDSLKPDHDVDGIGETFAADFDLSFYAGPTLINGASGCKAAYLYVNSAADATETFTETILQDNSTTNGALIFTSLIKQGKAVGFDGISHDFQMIVAENGHNGNEVTTLYYFYVEIA